MQASIKGFLKKYIKKPPENIYWWIYGFTLRNSKLPVDPRSFLFICKGNICRSVFAQALAVKTAEGKGIQNVVFDSAGLEVFRAMPPPQEAMVAAKRFGITLDRHRSKRISREMAESFDMVIAMEAWQLQALQRLYPQCSNRFFLLPLFDESRNNKKDFFSVYNIEDPFGKDLIRFRVCYERIENCLAGLFSQLADRTEK